MAEIHIIHQMIVAIHISIQGINEWLTDEPFSFSFLNVSSVSDIFEEKRKEKEGGGEIS
jgi:hypothetical protein